MARPLADIFVDDFERIQSRDLTSVVAEWCRTFSTAGDLLHAMIFVTVATKIIRSLINHVQSTDSNLLDPGSGEGMEQRQKDNPTAEQRINEHSKKIDNTPQADVTNATHNGLPNEPQHEQAPETSTVDADEAKSKALEERLLRLSTELQEVQSRTDTRLAAFTFVPLPEAALQSSFHKLHDFVSSLSLQICNHATTAEGFLPTIPQGLSLIHPLPSRYWIQGHAVFLLQAAIWSHLEAAFFSNPFFVFGDRAIHFAREWTSPDVSPQAELWRCLTVRILLTRAGLITSGTYVRPATLKPLVEVKERLRNRTSLQDSPYDHITADVDKDALESLHTARDAITSMFTKQLQDIVPFSVNSTITSLIESVMTRSQYLALAVAEQPSRYQFIYPIIGSKVIPKPGADPNPSWRPNQLCIGDCTNNPVLYVNQPGLRKWGLADFTHPNLCVDLIPAHVYFADAAIVDSLPQQQAAPAQIPTPPPAPRAPVVIRTPASASAPAPAPAPVPAPRPPPAPLGTQPPGPRSFKPKIPKVAIQKKPIASKNLPKPIPNRPTPPPPQTPQPSAAPAAPSNPKSCSQPPPKITIEDYDSEQGSSKVLYPTLPKLEGKRKEKGEEKRRVTGGEINECLNTIVGVERSKA